MRFICGFGKVCASGIRTCTPLARIFALVLVLAWSQANSQLKVTATVKLDSLARYVTTSTTLDRITTIQFESYASVGAFKLTGPLASTVDTLIFERSKKSQGIEVIDIGSQLMEIKKFDGTLVLRGLAFRMTKPTATLISAFELGKLNGSLVLDSCFVFGDTTEAALITWLGKPGSQIIFRRSFFVFPEANDVTQGKLLLRATNYRLTNNLFNYSGMLHAEVEADGEFRALNNSVNRTQFQLQPVVPQRASYFFSTNYIGHPGTKDAFGEVTPQYFLQAISFKTSESTVQNNVLYRSWPRFDYAANGTNWFDSVKTNVWRDSLNGAIKPVSERWNWYATGKDTGVGMGSGDGARVPAYNVFPRSPSDTSMNAEFQAGSMPMVINYDSCPFPRHFKLQRQLIGQPNPLAENLRILNPELGSLYFGPFQVRRIQLTAPSLDFGLPRLLSADTSGAFVSQRLGNATKPFSFANDSGKAQYFFLAFQGNTPRNGPSMAWVAPEKTTSSGLKSDDSLAYQTVMEAGNTLAKENLKPDFASDLRYLDRNFRITSTAVLSGDMAFGTVPVKKPWDSTRVFWQIKFGTKDSLQPAVPGARGIYSARLPARDTLEAYLVERQNVKRGSTQLQLADTVAIETRSLEGFQLYYSDTGYTPSADTLGLATKAYSMRFKGRVASDTVWLRLPSGVDVDPFKVLKRNSSGKYDSVVSIAPRPLDSAGSFRISILESDSLVRYFSAVPLNVKANIPFTTSSELGGLSFTNLYSTKPGLIRGKDFDAKLLEKTAGDSLPASRRLLAMQGIYSRFLSFDTAHPGFSVGMKLSPPKDPSQLQAFAFGDSRWRLLECSLDPLKTGVVRVDGVRIGDVAVLVLERLRPATDYVDTNIVVDAASRSITVNTTYLDPLIPGSLVRFQVQVKKVDQSGFVTEELRPAKSIGGTDSIDLSDSSGFFQYRVFYATDSTERYNAGERYISVEKFNWNRSLIRVGDSAKAKNVFHLIGFPYGTTLAGSMLRDTAKREHIGYYKLMKADSGTIWDSLETASSTTFPAGDAVVYSSTSAYTQRVDLTGAFQSPLPVSIPGDSLGGWKLISPPFPMTFFTSSVKSTSGKGLGEFRALKIDVTKSDTGKYSWIPDVDSLEGFKGYAYHFEPGESLIFDPWNARTSGSVPAKHSASASPASLEVSLQTGGIRRSARLFAGPGRSLSFLPTPGSGLDMRVGGKGGYLRKSVASLSRIDEPLVVQSPIPLRCRLELVRSESLAGMKDWQARLLNVTTGEILDPAGQELVLAKGSNEYRLVAGSGDFVRERTGLFAAGLPAELVLSQNYPNPFRGFTRIALDWPAETSSSAITGKSAGSPRRGVIDIFDARGKRVQRLDLGQAKAGRQWVNVDATRWQPGIYSYRLTVVGSAGTLRLSKKMLVLQ